jgi:hypothetical protein
MSRRFVVHLEWEEKLSPADLVDFEGLADFYFVLRRAVDKSASLVEVMWNAKRSVLCRHSVISGKGEQSDGVCE